MYSENLQKVRKLIAQLFPTGRAFRITRNSVKEKIVNGITLSDDRFIQDADGILDHILPDNDNFTEEDATIWELRLGINTNPDTPLEDRKAAIIQKLNHPGNIIARQGAGYIQDQLQLAGFNVFVHENIPEQDPNLVFGDSVNGIAVHATDVEHMETGMEHGQPALWPDVVANNIDWEVDQYFDIGENSKCVFFICEETLGTFVDVPEIRKEEFRQLILQLKPAQSIAYLGINYI